MRTISLLLSLTAFLSACSDDASGTPPLIALLEAQPTTIPAGMTSTVSGSFQFEDPDGDVSEMNITVEVGGQTTNLAPTPLTGYDGMARGTVAWQTTVPATSAATYHAQFWVTDDGGNDSNKLPLTIVAQ